VIDRLVEAVAEEEVDERRRQVINRAVEGGVELKVGERGR
jgi:hypothetical protein